MIVLDASAAVGLLTQSAAGAGPLADRLDPLPDFHVPELFDVEVLSALRGLERAGKIGGGRLQEALTALEDFRAVRWRHEELRPGIWRNRHRLSIYDAAYVTLAKLLDVPLITADSRLAGSVGDDVAVELFAPI